MRKLGLVLCLAGIVGCSSDPAAGEQSGQTEAALVQAQSCNDVLQALQEDALAKVDLMVEGYFEFGYCGAVGPVSFAGGDEPARAPTGADDDSSGERAPSAVSDTNRQVASVDEADIVKAADGGTKLYVIRGDGFHEFDSWPAAATSKVADLEIEGHAHEMFVDGNRAVVFSHVYGVEALDEDDPCNRGGGGGAEPVARDVYYCGRVYLKTTVISLEGEKPEVEREIYLDGSYTSSRRHNDIVRAVIQTQVKQPLSVPYMCEFLHGQAAPPQTRQDEIDRAQAWARAAKSAIRETRIEDWLPSWAERVEGEIVQRSLPCADFYAPSPGLAGYGMTQILGIDVAAGGEARITSILGWASEVYANASALILTQPDYGWYGRDLGHDRTAVHRFAVSFDRKRTPYEGSGFVAGLVEDQFSIDERDGVVRIATTRTRWPRPEDGGRPFEATTDNLVSTMRLDEGKLALLGVTPSMAEGERIFSARFIGDLAYVVTFRQVDPLFAIDLSDPSTPKVLGELKIPGFSDYMHPLGDGHLLTIGRDIDEETLIDRGTALQIFDVSDPTAPKQKFKALVGQGFSEANHNHKAFNFYREQGILAFPFVSYEGDFSSTLELWNVSVDAGFSRRGSVDHSALVLRDCGGSIPPIDGPLVADVFYGYCNYLPQVLRGVFIDDYVYSISHGGVLVHDVADLTTPVATAVY